MNKALLLISGILILFLLNITLYATSENYRFFVKKIKNPEEIVYNDQDSITDSPSPEKISPGLIDSLQQQGLSIITPLTWEENEIRETSSEAKKSIVLGQKYQEILDLFADYKLGKLELRSDLFGITDEYPDPYHEYYSKDFTLYFFPSKSYSELRDIFTLQKQLPIEINEVNNFATQSFFINMIPRDDKNVRLVVDYKSIVFWLKIKKDEYNEIKALLETL